MTNRYEERSSIQCKHITKGKSLRCSNPLGKLLSSILAHPINIHIGDNTVSVIDRLFNLFEVPSHPLSPPFIAVSDEPAALHQPLRSFSATGVENIESMLKILVRLHPVVFQQCSQDCRVLKAEASPCAVVRRRGVCRIAGKTDTPFRECGQRMFSQVENCPLGNDQHFTTYGAQLVWMG
jgi:hypothetical protein